MLIAAICYILASLICIGIFTLGYAIGFSAGWNRHVIENKRRKARDDQ